MLAALCAALLCVPAQATWSILIVDTRTREIAVGSCTCLTSFDLQATTPVVLVGVGAATAQSSIDSGAVNRMRIHSRLLAGVPLAQILADLAVLDGAHQSRQYGMVDATGDTLTFTGASAGAWAGGVTGSSGTIHYAVQGNVLTGSPVVDMAEQAILTTSGDLSQKLMAAMEAARAMGGDGRCSCSPSTPTACGSPPAAFTKASHIGFMIVARQGDTDGVCTAGLGCANGSYFMALNVPFQSAGAPDPVVQLQGLHAAWRSTWIGRPDHNLSDLVLADSAVPVGQMTVATITARDWQGAVLTPGGHTVVPVVDPASTAAAVLGPVVDNGDGTYTFPVTAGATGGSVVLRATIDDGAGAVLLSPATTLDVVPCVCGDCDLSQSGPDILDAFEAARIAVLLVAPIPGQSLCCDVDGLPGVAATDALLLAQLSVGLPGILSCP